VQAEDISLVLSECRALVEPRIRKQFDAMKTRVEDRALAIWLI